MNEFYETKLLKYPSINDGRRYGWNSTQSQVLRFHQILRLIRTLPTALDQLTILDIGCGSAAFFNILHKSNIGARYLGVDSQEEHVFDARARMDELGLNAEIEHFYWAGIIQFPFDEDIDIIVESGLFAMCSPSERARLLLPLFGLPKYGFIGTFYQDSPLVVAAPGLVSTTPADVLSLIDMTRFKYIVLGDYMPYDFTVGVFHVPEDELVTEALDGND